MGDERPRAPSGAADSTANERDEPGVTMLGIGVVPIALGIALLVGGLRLRVPIGRCANCGYDLRGEARGDDDGDEGDQLDRSTRCPECGAPTAG